MKNSKIIEYDMPDLHLGMILDNSGESEMLIAYT